MDAPIWSNDLLYLWEMILTIAVTVALTALCFYFSKRADRKRAVRIAHGASLHSATRPQTTQKPKSNH